MALASLRASCNRRFIAVIRHEITNQVEQVPIRIDRCSVVGLKELHPECVVFDGHVRATPTDEEHDGDVTFNVDPDTNDDKLLLNQYNTKGLHTIFQ